MSIGEIIHTPNTSTLPSATDLTALDEALDEILLTGALSERSYAWAIAQTPRRPRSDATSAKFATVLAVSRSMTQNHLAA
jgi:hypothetical protein